MHSPHFARANERSCTVTILSNKKVWLKLLLLLLCLIFFHYYFFFFINYWPVTIIGTVWTVQKWTLNKVFHMNWNELWSIYTLEKVFICSLFQRICSMLAHIGQQAPGKRLGFMDYFNTTQKFAAYTTKVRLTVFWSSLQKCWEPYYRLVIHLSLVC